MPQHLSSALPFDWHIRRVCPQLYQGVAGLLISTFPHDINQQLAKFTKQIEIVLTDPVHIAFVAVYSANDESEKVIGFVDNFVTETPAGVKRWEIDLLAVDSEWQGHGIGRALIQKSFGEAQTKEIDIVRALVRDDNVACQQAFGQSRFQRCSPMLDLFICAMPGKSQVEMPSGTYLVKVQTCLYSGYWVEDMKCDLTKNQMEMARMCLVNPLGHEIVGGLMCHKPGHTHPNGYDHVGTFEWWTKERNLTSASD